MGIWPAVFDNPNLPENTMRRPGFSRNTDDAGLSSCWLHSPSHISCKDQNGPSVGLANPVGKSMANTPTTDLAILFENEAWQQPLFDVLDTRGLSYTKYDLKSAAFGGHDCPAAKLYFNQASPSAYVRGHPRVIQFTLALLRNLQIQGVQVLNGVDVFAFELSKSAQIAQLRELGIDHPSSIMFNDVEALARRDDLRFPAMLKPEQGGSGARMHKIDSLDELRHLLHDQPGLWEPDQLLLLQEYLPHDPDFGIVRMEFLGDELLYAMRVVTHGRYNLCPSEECNPAEAGAAATCTIPSQQDQNAQPVEFYPFHDLADEARESGLRIVQSAKMDVAGIEFLETPDGRRVFYDINANSNLRRPIGEAFGFDPFERVADFLECRLALI
ncbi:MAG: glutathione synthase/RimK-type ligase-like ATP-grasp enzyme [Verrucomicrobiales bacterium]|jgi:glutathione synthase/RimK-type ligase-like ATP-grasp enzyme